MWGQVGGHDDHVKTLCPLVVQEFERVRSLFSGGELETNVVFLLAKIRQHVINNFNQLEKGEHAVCTVVVCCFTIIKLSEQCRV